ncbi:MAG: xanthine phosphoribosyltransferase [Clostridia bacterium]
MQLLKERILKDGRVFDGDVLYVGSFLNHQIDTDLMDKIGNEIATLFCGQKITKILTIEASGIAIACATARYINVPVLFAKKSKTSNLTSDVLRAEVVSYTHHNISTIFVEREFILPTDKILVVDDFLANGEAIRGLKGLIEEGGAELVGCAIAIEKGFQGGGDELRQSGIDVKSLAIIDSMGEDGIVFRD